MLITAWQRLGMCAVFITAGNGSRGNRDGERSYCAQPGTALQLLVPGRLGGKTGGVVLLHQRNLCTIGLVTTGMVTHLTLLFPTRALRFGESAQQDTQD